MARLPSGVEPPSRERVLDELEFLAGVEHALVVEYLSISCALGHDLEPEQGGATTKQGRTAAAAASALAQGEMFHLKGVNRGLVDAGRFAQFARAAGISSPATDEIALGPPTAFQLQRFLERGDAIASAVDERYRRLRAAVTSDPVFEGDVLDEFRFVIVDNGPTHLAAFAAVRESFGDLSPADFLRATRRKPKDAFEQRLLNVSDRNYDLIMTALENSYMQQDLFLAGSFCELAVSAMEGLDEINRALVQRGLLPPFAGGA